MSAHKISEVLYELQVKYGLEESNIQCLFDKNYIRVMRMQNALGLFLKYNDKDKLSNIIDYLRLTLIPEEFMTKDTRDIVLREYFGCLETLGYYVIIDWAKIEIHDEKTYLTMKGIK